MTFLYFAYGSNMLPARLLGRCPSAKVVGTGVARAWSLAFSKASKDGSGKATLVAEPNSAVPGVIFEIDLAERELLDRHEGVGSGYRRDDAFAVEGITVPTSSYLGTSLDHTLRPFDWYLATVVAGADYYGLGWTPAAMTISSVAGSCITSPGVRSGRAVSERETIR